MNWKEKIKSYDTRRDIVIPGGYAETLTFCVEHFVGLAHQAIADHGAFYVALSGGSTPQAIFKKLAEEYDQSQTLWSNTFLFWSDERVVSHGHPESNYYSAMQAGLSSLPVPSDHIFPMPVEGDDLDLLARNYEKLITQTVSTRSFDLMMLGLGEDGHTASLFPKTHGLHPTKRLVIPNYIPHKEIWRMTVTFDCINASQHIAVYVLGKNKALILKKALTSLDEPDLLPIQRVGTREHKALFIVDQAAASEEVYQ